MKNYKKIGWIEEIPGHPDEQSGKGLPHEEYIFLLSGCLSLIPLKENKSIDHPCQEISETPELKKEKS
ncbi:hypothetical protein C1637_05955 [Chryseobacterium lactis]|uniref:Cupin domain-containing protein n=1 Tax=Chryseobacterium lactis TaxID=1241981 RepID=A0A3G6RLK4_CHRLC|nr:hypothetical protein [Chryseobacterium lactis]AZA84385.1 hypothetical protein EG342_21925 [Chryseobacterium lactis]AZB04773.1 hypothetical protein EG341_12805 [Chryseobacterium lactis]PNW14503.1 hypothetical protein C1637_05955 [Chryseobacterium lactis]